MTTLTTPSLSKIEGQVLRTVRFIHRDERWNHPTLSQLRAYGFVSSETVPPSRGGISQSNYRWRITPAGVAAYEDWRG